MGDLKEELNNIDSELGLKNKPTFDFSFYDVNDSGIWYEIR
ncbi:MAG: hypothetical protein ACXAC2_01885 [Candidatus Kariarchaeaceae archaeon]|jgi:hypothetical protein